MAVYRFYDPGMKDGMDSVAKVMDSIGQFERQRQDAQLSSNLMRIASEPAGSPEERMQKVYSAVADFQPQYSGGLGGVMQKAGNFFAPQSQMPQRMGGMAVEDLLQQINRERDTADHGTRLEQQAKQTVDTSGKIADQRWTKEQEQQPTRNKWAEENAKINMDERIRYTKETAGIGADERRLKILVDYFKQYAPEDNVGAYTELTRLLGGNERDAQAFIMRARGDVSARPASRGYAKKAYDWLFGSPSADMENKMKSARQINRASRELQAGMGGLGKEQKAGLGTTIMHEDGTIVDDVKEKDLAEALKNGWKVIQ